MMALNQHPQPTLVLLPVSGKLAFALHTLAVEATIRHSTAPHDPVRAVALCAEELGEAAQEAVKLGRLPAEDPALNTTWEMDTRHKCAEELVQLAIIALLSADQVYYSATGERPLGEFTTRHGTRVIVVDDPHTPGVPPTPEETAKTTAWYNDVLKARGLHENAGAGDYISDHPFPTTPPPPPPAEEGDTD